MNKITWQDFAKKKDETILILPIGSLEQHGPHLPMGTDVIISYNLALLLAQRIDGIVAPPINYGYKSLPTSGGGPLFPGTVDLQGNTLIALVKDLLEEFVMDGVKKIFILNGHFENEAFILEAVDIVTRQAPENLKIVVTNWWDQISQSVLNEVFDVIPFPGWALEHAAITETSLVLKFSPELVHLERLIDEGIDNPPNYHQYPVKEDIVPSSGLLHTARTSSAEKGELLTKEILRKLEEVAKYVF